MYKDKVECYFMATSMAIISFFSNFQCMSFSFALLGRSFSPFTINIASFSWNIHVVSSSKTDRLNSFQLENPLGADIHSSILHSKIAVHEITVLHLLMKSLNMCLLLPFIMGMMVAFNFAVYSF